MHFVKTLVLCITCRNCRNVDEEMLKGEKSIEILKTIGLIENI